MKIHCLPITIIHSERGSVFTGQQIPFVDPNVAKNAYSKLESASMLTHDDQMTFQDWQQEEYRLSMES
jgi:hypothetical protein